MEKVVAASVGFSNANVSRDYLTKKGKGIIYINTYFD